MIGRTLGHYEILEPLGAGGMGEVFRAHDTALNRDVAIKVLPEAVAGDADRLARFQREAEALAALNHPNVAQVHGLEKSGETPAIVMELVEGPTLAERLEAGPIPLDEALLIARQIAEGLEAAHERGIIHRDLKPPNIKVTDDGTVKLLDFGLAKAFSPDVATADGLDAAHSPTVTSPAMTRAGIILGTAAYMSPEQARGKPFDKRTDIWAFGCVLYEMLTGRRAFGGETVSDTMAAILKEEPAWGALPESIPWRINELLHRCLQKDPQQRLRDIGDARIEINRARSEPDVRPSAEARGTRPAPAWRTAIIVVVVVAVMLTAAYWLGLRSGRSLDSTTERVARPPAALEIELPAEASLPVATDVEALNAPLLAISPDGTVIVYVGQSGSNTQLYRRPVDSFDDPVPIEGTEGARFAFFKPDGTALGFVTSDEVKKVSLRPGDRPQTVCQAREAGRAAWTENGTIYFTDNEGYTLSSVPEDGGPVAKIDELGRGGLPAYLTEMLPDGEHALIKVASDSISSDYADIYLLSTETKIWEKLIERAYDARYVSSGHMLFARGGTLYAQAFDVDTLKLHGNEVPLELDVSMESLFGNVKLAVSHTGTLVYVPGSDRSVGRIAVVERHTNESAWLEFPAAVYGVLKLSPDGRRIAVQVAGIADQIKILDRSTRRQRTVPAPGNAGWPIWSPDGTEVIYSATVPGEGYGLFASSADRDEEPRRIYVGEGRLTPNSLNPDRNVLGVTTLAGSLQFGFLEVDTRELGWASDEAASEWAPAFLPDGRAFVYTSNRTGRYEVRYRVFPLERSLGEQVSINGGLEPAVCQSCQEVFYRHGRRFFSSSFKLGDTPTFDPPELVFETDFVDTPGRSYDVSPDGQTLFVIKSTGEQSFDRLHVVLNWFEELKTKVPTGR